MRSNSICAFVRSVFTLVLASSPVFSQSLGNAGTIEGTVIDPSGSVIPKARILLRNSVSGYQQSTSSAGDGTFRLSNIPPNPYHLEVTASGFAPFSQDVTIRSAVPLQVKATLALAGAQSTVTVEAAGADILEVDPSAHTDTDRTLITKLPTFDPGGGLTQAITYASGGVVAGAHGPFPPRRRPFPNQLHDRRSAHQRSTEQSLFHAASAQRHRKHGDRDRNSRRGV